MPQRGSVHDAQTVMLVMPETVTRRARQVRSSYYCNFHEGIGKRPRSGGYTFIAILQ